MAARPSELPSLEVLGKDLLDVPWPRRAFSLAVPFLLTAAFFLLATRGWWPVALLCPVLLSFLTYGSTSHDLVHRNLRLPAWINETLLSAIELLAFRSGHAYRTVHLNHHAHFPDEDDLEGAAARMSWFRALLDGVTLQYRLWAFALRRPGTKRRWVIVEGTTVLLLFAVCLALLPVSPWPAVYAGLMIAGSWVYPFVTAYLVHDAGGAGELTLTRLFRGRVLSWLALEHLYHLEHHLYRQVPHHNWPRLARRLDPYFAGLGIHPVKLLF